MMKAMQLYPHIYPDDPDNRKFKGGTGWLKRFRDRHGVRSLSMQGEPLSAAIMGALLETDAQYDIGDIQRKGS